MTLFLFHFLPTDALLFIFPPSMAAAKRSRPERQRILLITKEQMDHLHSQVIDGATNAPNGTVSPCLRFSGHTDQEDGSGYPRNITLGKRQRQGYGGRGVYDPSKDPVAHVPFSATWSAGQVLLAHRGELPAEDGREWQASHLCDHPWCVRSGHLVWEVDHENYSRKKCGNKVVCEECGHENFPCKHNPKCLDMSECTCAFHSK